MLRAVLAYPDPRLAFPARPFTEAELVCPGTHRLLDDMAETLYSRDGVGLAAPQIGESVMAVVIDYGTGLIELLNPVIVNPGLLAPAATIQTEEACLSVPGVTARLTRWARVTVRYRTRAGERSSVELEGFPAVVYQHEIDHLAGRLILDRMSRLARRVAEQKIARLAGRRARG